MLDRLDDDCKQLFRDAREGAQRLGHAFLDVEHVMLAALELPGSLAASMLRAVGLDVAALRARLEACLPRGAGPRSAADSEPLGPRCRRLVELAAQQANARGDRAIGAGHLVLAWASLPDSSLRAEGETRPTQEELGRALDELDPPADPLASKLAQAAGLCFDAAASLRASEQPEHAQRLHELAREIAAAATELRKRPEA